MNIKFKKYEMTILGSLIKRELLEMTNGKYVTESRLANLYELDSKLKTARKSDEVALVKVVKPYLKRDRESTSYYRCGDCDNMIIGLSPKHCGDCGAKLDWSEE